MAMIPRKIGLVEGISTPNMTVELSISFSKQHRMLPNLLLTAASGLYKADMVPIRKSRTRNNRHALWGPL